MAKIPRPELLLPAKNLSSIKAGIEYGDAFYFGTKMFTMRYKSSFEANDTKELIDFLHNNGKKAYITVNNIVYNHHLKQLDYTLETLKSLDVDAVIVSDMAAIRMAKEKGIEIHISTQANIANTQAALMYRDLGATRVVLARELSLESIKQIKKETQMEIETFVHGAMCMAISGRCYLSLHLTGRNANTGTCSHECRRFYKLTDVEEPFKEFISDGKAFFNAKDLKTIDFVPELIEARIDSFKIEGRHRNQYYVNTVGRCYREAIDSYFDGSFSDKKLKEWNKELLKVFNRGYSSGFFFGNPGAETYNINNSHNSSEYRELQFGRVSKIDGKNITIKAFISGLKTGDEIMIKNRKDFLKCSIKDIKSKSGKKLKEVLKGDFVTIVVDKDTDALNNKEDLFVCKIVHKSHKNIG